MGPATDRNQHVAFTLLDFGGKFLVKQTEPDGTFTQFDPYDWGAFTRGSLVVRAVQIPRPFRVGGDICTNGYLVFDGKLKAISAETFNRDYEPLGSRVAA